MGDIPSCGLPLSGEASAKAEVHAIFVTGDSRPSVMVVSVSNYVGGFVQGDRKMNSYINR
jgi:hypothetical protein